MSYVLTLSFAPIENKKQVLDTLTTVSDLIWEQRKSIITCQRHSCPSFLAKENNKEADMQWLNWLMTNHIIYWKKHGLIAIHGSGRVVCKDLFPTTVTFQDKYDCDYAMHIYKGIPMFYRLREKAENFSKKRIHEILKKYGGEEYTIEEIEEDLYSARREALYFMIEHELGIMDLVTENPSKKFQVFNISPIHGIKRWEECKKLLETANKSLYQS